MFGKMFGTMFGRAAHHQGLPFCSVLAVETEGGMEAADGKLGIFRGDQDGYLDLRSRDDLDVDAALGEGFEHRPGNTRLRAHGSSDNRDLGDGGI